MFDLHLSYPLIEGNAVGHRIPTIRTADLPLLAAVIVADKQAQASSPKVPAD